MAAVAALDWLPGFVVEFAGIGRHVCAVGLAFYLLLCSWIDFFFAALVCLFFGEFAELFVMGL